MTWWLIIKNNNIIKRLIRGKRVVIWVLHLSASNLTRNITAVRRWGDAMFYEVEMSSQALVVEIY